MEENKMHPGILAIILVALLFAGWESTLIVSILLIIFGKLDERRKTLLITVLTFLVGIALFNSCWNLITGGITLILNTLEGFINFISAYLSEPISTYGLSKYVINPVTTLLTMASSIVTYAVLLLKFLFAISILTGKNINTNFIFKYIYNYIEKAYNFVNQNAGNFNQNNNYQQPNNMQ